MFKSLHYFKSWLLLMLCMVVGGVGSAFAEDTPEVTLDFTSQSNWDIPTSGTNKTLASFTDGTYTIKLYSTTNYKMNNGYLILGKKDSYLELPAFSFDVEKIEIVGHSGASGSVKQNIYVGSTAVSTETEGANGVTNAYMIDANYQSAGNVYKLMITSAHNTQIDYIKIYKKAAASETTTTVTIDDSDIDNTDVYTSTSAGSLAATVSDNAGQAISGASVTWSSSDEGVATIAANGAVTLVAAGTTTITATYAGVSGTHDPSSATYELTVIDSNAPGTVNNPYTVAQAIANTPSSGTSDNVYIKGIVSQFSNTSIVDDGKNYRYYISDDGTTTGQLLVYKGKGLNNEAFSEADDLQLGDEVVILGGLTIYNNTKEVAANNYIVSLHRKVMPDLAFDQESYSVNIGEALTITASATNSDGAITYESSNTNVAEIDANGVVTAKSAGTTTIIATIAATADVRGTSVTAELTVVDPNAKVTKFEKVTDASTLKAGDKLVIVYEDGSVALSNEWNYENRNIKETSIVIDNKTIEQTDKLEVFTLGGTTGSWTLQGATFGFIGNATSGTGNYILGGLAADATNAKSEISITTDGDAVIKFAGNGSKQWLRYNPNNGNGLFACYGEDKQNAVQLYKEALEKITLDDTSNGNAAKIAAANGQKVNVQVERTLSPNYYNTLFLPFAMTADQVTAAFGEGVQVATFTGMLNNSSTTFGFGNVTAMEANTGYLVKPAAAVNGFTVKGVTITSAASVSPSSDWIMYGSYDTFANSASNEVYYFTISGTVKKLASTGSIKGLRAFMMKGATEQTVKAINSNVILNYGGGSTETGLARADFFLFLDGGTTTGINSIENGQIDNDAPAYNLAGQKVGKGYKGIVIINGKKVVK